MSALEAARARALASVRTRKNKQQQQAANNEAHNTAASAAVGSVDAQAGASTAAAAANQPSDAVGASAAASESSTPTTRRRPRKRRFDILPSDQLASRQVDPLSSSAITGTAAAASASAAAAATAPAAPLASAEPDPTAAALTTNSHSAAPHSAADAAHAASATPAAPAAAAAAAASLAASTAHVSAGSTTNAAAAAAKRSRWAPPVPACTATSMAMLAGAPGANTASHANSTALATPPGSVTASAGDRAVNSTALVSLDGGCGEGSVIRRSRFSPAAAPPPWDAAALSWDVSTLLALHPTHLPAGARLLLPSICAGMSLGAADAMLARMRLDAIEVQLRALAAGRPLDEVDPRPTDATSGAPRARSPSPEPVYDAQGKRTNTRPQRLRTTLLALQHSIVTAALARSPYFKPPKGFRSSAAGRIKFERKLLIPLDEYPDYNFKGVIIGARGLKQQELQTRTGCKIAVRGRGSWSSSRPDSMRQRHSDDDEPQHCWIQADTPEALERGVAEVSKLLVPMSDEARRRSLQELAELNGWVREPQACRVCGATDHLMKACPDRNGGRGFIAAAVSCKLCGARTHPAMDCPSARGLSRDEIVRRMRDAGARDADQRVDDEYEHFMAELMGEEGAALSSGGGTASKRLLLLAGGNGHSLPSSSSLVARGSDGVQLCLLPPTSREEHHAAQQHSQLQQQGKIRAESFREYTPRDAAASAHDRQPHPPHPDPHPAPAPASGWATHQLASPHIHQHASGYAHATQPPPLPPHPTLFVPYSHQPHPHQHLHPPPPHAHAVVPHAFPYAAERFEPPPPGI